jgi:hypothetical protein
MILSDFIPIIEKCRYRHMMMLAPIFCSCSTTSYHGFSFKTIIKTI